ncbi:NAD(P)-dependent dehydrogenase, short-chain alcohol dehydrogenase family [Mucilaginibacter gossypiicola]|uniref:NAD(P)-dependent dehydrogenase, short-chain alcohol dehydrogenase family n=1 Tax=Mucilaginibacter gossypiicola TaxID=551995 RepID=A0A1H8KA75_9SPHI|nr:SDR family NAD(P)-dependent oxidoreductase [Mucilaginibacter gossypiicola]SEN89870.1 NAD(P)-dependent dehydrogenase, short-chain alcohol dehydrogenase family [Mucilaginibacter gossypiicola]
MPIKTTVITGATSGIGKATATALAAQDHAVYLLVRNIIRGEAVKQEIIDKTGNKHVYVIKCDLADLQSVREAAAGLSQKLMSVNTLINNAGAGFSERQVSKDGFEMTFAANHLGHFLLTLSLMPLLERGQARIINVSSEGHKLGKPNFDDLQSVQKYSSVKAYGMAKLFNVYFARSLAQKFGDKGILAFSLHPGVVNSSFADKLRGFEKILMKLARPFMITSEQGAETSIYLATAPQLDKFNGSYFKKKKVAKTAVIAKDVAAQEKLWQISEKLISKSVV